MPYRNESAVQERILTLENEIAELGRRSHEQPYLETKKKSLEDELAVLRNQRPPATKTTKMLAWLRALTTPQKIGCAFLFVVLVGAGFCAWQQTNIWLHPPSSVVYDTFSSRAGSPLEETGRRRCGHGDRLRHAGYTARLQETTAMVAAKKKGAFRPVLRRKDATRPA